MLYGANGQKLAAVQAPIGGGRPQPNEEAEARVREVLKSIDGLLDVKWLPTVYYNERGKYYEGRYALISMWPQSDTRWQMYHAGEIGEPFDMLGFFCEDIHDAETVPRDVDSMEHLIIELLGKCDNTRYSWRDRMKDMVEKNVKNRQSKKQVVMDQAQDVAEVLWHAVGRHDATKVERMMKEIGEREYE